MVKTQKCKNGKTQQDKMQICENGQNTRMCKGSKRKHNKMVITQNG